ncbi:MAG TPA: hypothetical protein VLC92_10405 [Rhodocyclaceae bacterium]|nr:hypothetical protein [Rhodocyclaceae bacterium]
MDQKLPFTSYDFWAYLSAGFLLLFAVDYVIGTHLLARDAWTVVQSIGAISCAYAVGQIIGSMSLVAFENILVGKLLGYPRDILFGNTKAGRWARLLLPAYFQTLPLETQRAALERGKKVGINSPGEALFWPAYANARTTPAVMSRLENFLNLYGFCRNVAFVAYVDAALLYWSYRWGGGPSDNLVWACGALFIGAGMTVRYLKFFRCYALEVFTSYAYSQDHDKSQ